MTETPKPDEYAPYLLSFREPGEAVNPHFTSAGSYAVVSLGRSPEEAIGYAISNPGKWLGDADGIGLILDGDPVRVTDLADIVLGPEGLELIVTRTGNTSRRNGSATVTELPLTEIGLATYPCNQLERANIRTVGDLIKHTDHEIYVLRGVGMQSMDLIEDYLSKNGLSFKETSL